MSVGKRMLWQLDKKQLVRMLGRIKKKDYCIICVRTWAPVCYHKSRNFKKMNKFRMDFRGRRFANSLGFWE